MKFVLFGGTAASQELSDFLASRFSVPVEVYHSFKILDGSADVNNYRSLRQQLGWPCARRRFTKHRPQGN